MYRVCIQIIMLIECILVYEQTTAEDTPASTIVIAATCTMRRSDLAGTGALSVAWRAQRFLAEDGKPTRMHRPRAAIHAS
jgi:hypothetical protein